MSETAASLHDALLRAFDENGISGVVIARLVGFASNGASVMVGRHNGLAKRLDDDVDHHVFQMHCMAHRLQLAAGHCFTSLPFLKTEFERTVNAIYSFYNNKAVKRKASLQATAEPLGSEVQLYELVYIHQIRWTASELRALQKLKANTVAIYNNLQEIQASLEFDQDSKNQAMGFRSTISNIRFHAILLIMTDALKVVTQTSQLLQKQTGAVMGMEKIRASLLESLDSLKTAEGQEISYFLLHAKCFKDVAWKRCLVSDMDDKDFMVDSSGADPVIFKQPDTGRTSKYPKLSRFRVEFITSLKEEQDSYFPEGSLSMYGVLDPRSLPADLSTIPVYSPKIMPLAERFGFDEQATWDQFATLLTDLITGYFATYCAHKNNDDAVFFWSYFLDSADIAVDNNIKNCWKQY